MDKQGVQHGPDPTHPWEAQLLSISVDKCDSVTMLICTTCSLSLRKSRIQLHKEMTLLHDKPGWVCGVKSTAVIDKQHLHVCVLAVQVGEGSVQCKRHCIVSGSSMISSLIIVD